MLPSQTRDAQEASGGRRADLRCQLTKLIKQKDRLLNLRLLEEIDEQTFARKQTEFRDREADFKLKIEVVDRLHDELADLAVTVLYSRKALPRWLAAEHAEKRPILEIVCLNLELDGATRCLQMRKPLNVLAEGFVWKKVGATTHG